MIVCVLVVVEVESVCLSVDVMSVMMKGKVLQEQGEAVYIDKRSST